ncbi:alpha-keto acid decarboxylase family protein [Staphylococcus sp. SQ8-PEA]|uniref:Alpha-keto-acid decarboxylase n=1 Tax=Staphylococcus marylandisciuri TaxID=2981529 RepID=A0ABT2QPE8_9STAP|nr:alpha-keto acid decarboxylase family protein [Staphylococcus marylandisciuri]MCU5745852.1 alpha-keto acid decarboxylase family protein [Staphylococcus marylandisciuri]
MKRRVGQYLMDCISELGIDRVFGVPGDFNLTFLDDITERDDMKWVGNTNELNASYAADGYARIHGVSALVTTFGVGELSAINGVAGSYAEHVPVIQITGAPTTVAEEKGAYLHHSLGEGSFDNYRKMYQKITTTQAYITADNAQTEIPRVLNEVINEKRPVHIHLPIDVAATEIEVENEFSAPEHESSDVKQYIKAIETQLSHAKQPVILTGHEINSFDLHEELEDVVNRTQIPVAQLSFGKSAFNEENPYYIGIYDGEVAEDDIKSYVDQSDCILLVGSKLTDTATAGFSYGFNEDDIAYINHHNFKVGETRAQDVHLIDLVNGMKDIDYQFEGDYPKLRNNIEAVEPSNEPLTQAEYFSMLSGFFKKDDVILADQGTSFFGSYTLPLSQNNRYIAQPLWGSIGYTLPATLGAQLADSRRRNILLIGEGAFQMTAQEFAVMIRERIKSVLFVVNNDGYTVERKIHGEEAPYNDITMWNYTMLPQLFNGEEEVMVHDVRTSAELQEALNTINRNTDKMHLVEVKMTKEDAPKKLIKLGQVFADQNS